MLPRPFAGVRKLFLYGGFGGPEGLIRSAWCCLLGRSPFLYFKKPLGYAFCYSFLGGSGPSCHNAYPREPEV